ncbi:aquaporin-like protein [Ephemerocybe angulata]|uniref:Aquaporin-like protein n=1 Tax=Ephemerocybe angulata TaxID=980116 RepID=A0A8H6HR51_9AGAR|nr:aquaporin-like protein [Tulosesus angulatus]
MGAEFDTIGKTGTSDLVITQTAVSSDTEAQVLVVPDHIHDHRVSSYRKALHAIREPMAEFIGTAILIIFGAGAGCSTVLSSNQGVAPSSRGDFFSINFGWAIGIAMGVWVSGGISGGHINPAITLGMATWRGFPWRKVPAFILAQVLGALVGAALVYGLYFQAIDIFEGAGVRTQATAGIFATYSLPYMTAAASFFTEFLTTAILFMMILALTDKRNGIAPPLGLLPLALFVLFLGFGISLGMQTAYALNPARDFGPRVFLAMAGYGKEVFTFRSHYWIWCPIIAPIAGAQAGALLYDFFLFTGQGILNPNGPY